MDRLTEFTGERWIARQERLNGKTIGDKDIYEKLADYEDTGLTPAEALELAQAQAYGRLVVLPCKVGDTVFSLWGRVDSKKQYIRSATVTVSNLIYYLIRIRNGRSFVTRDEAQAALDRMEGWE